MGNTQFFTTSIGARIAYARHGSGPPLVLNPPFISHLELNWNTPFVRRFHEALASRYTVILYDRYGCGLSDRDRTDFSLDADLLVLAELVDHLELSRFSLTGPSAGSASAIVYAASHPTRLDALILHGAGFREEPESPVQSALYGLIRAEPRLGYEAHAKFLLPTGTPDEMAWFTRSMREGASTEVMIGLAAAELTVDLSDDLARIRTPTLIVHRRDDLLVSIEDCSELAARIDGAQLAVIPGDAHIFETGDITEFVSVVFDFLAHTQAKPRPAESEIVASTNGLTGREGEILRLLAAGLTNQEIADRLSISVHTVERHITNLYGKLGVRSRTEAAGWALRHS